MALYIRGVSELSPDKCLLSINSSGFMVHSANTRTFLLFSTIVIFNE